MNRHRFRWTRKSFQHARHLARLLGNFRDLPDEPPAVVRRYWKLLERYPQRDDPLLTPFEWRPSVIARTDDVPF